MGKSIDQHCYDLAEMFLKDCKGLKQPITAEDKQELAEQIQQTVEDFISGLYEEEE